MLSKIVCMLKTQGIDNYEIYVQTPVVTQLYLRLGKIEFLNEVKHLGYSVRVLDKGFGMISSNQTEDAQIEQGVRNCLLMARQSKPEEFTFPSSKKSSHVDVVDERIKEQPLNVVKDFAQDIIDAAETEKVELPLAKVKAFHIKTSILNSEGLEKEKEETMLFTEASFKTSRGDKLSEYWTSRYSRRPEDIPSEQLGRWAKLARDNLEAKMPKTEKLEVILPPQVVCDLLVPVVSNHCTGRALKTGFSKFEQGEKVASKSLTVVDDGLHPYGLQSSPFDDEGNPQTRTVVIENGVFKSYLYDQYYGLQLGEDSTGNAIRQSTAFFFIDNKFRIAPSNQTSNLKVQPGNKKLDELTSEVSKGLLIHNFSWMAPNQASGSFGSEIRNASLIEEGEIKHAVKGGIVSGNVFEMMKNITGISKYPEVTSGQTAFSCVSPYLRFKDVQIAGN